MTVVRKILSVVALGALAVSAAVYAQVGIDGTRVAGLLKTRLPRTQVSAIDCSKVNGVCEVVAGKSVFYTDASARYLFVGRLYDMETRQDLTAAKLLEINPDTLLGGVGDDGRQDGAELASGGSQAAQGAQAAQLGRGTRVAVTQGQGQRAALTKVDLSGLPANGAIVWGPVGGKPVTIFTDFRCGYCRMLVASLEQMNVRVTERPISVLGSRAIADRVYCARDKARAVRDAYAGLEVQSPNCDTSGLDANERFARQNNFMGTPIIVRRDGAVIEGYRPRDVLERWLNEA